MLPESAAALNLTESMDIKTLYKVISGSSAEIEKTLE
jgi:hypothetical protein